MNFQTPYFENTKYQIIRISVYQIIRLSDNRTVLTLEYLNINLPDNPII